MREIRGLFEGMDTQNATRPDLGNDEEEEEQEEQEEQEQEQEEEEQEEEEQEEEEEVQEVQKEQEQEKREQQKECIHSDVRNIPRGREKARERGVERDSGSERTSEEEMEERRETKQKTKAESNSDNEDSENPAPLPDLSDSNWDGERRRGQSVESGYVPPLDVPPPLPSDLYELPRERLIIQRVIGEGAFGVVAKGLALDISGLGGWLVVAIKMLKSKFLHIYRKIMDRMDSPRGISIVKGLREGWGEGLYKGRHGEDYTL